jgi:hypothetical protein
MQHVRVIADRILTNIGIAPITVTEKVRAAAEAALTQRGYTATIEQFQWGKLTVGADPHTARLLRFDKDPLLSDINRAVGENVCVELAVRVRRSP